MHDRKTRFWSASILILLCVLVAPAEVASQCAVINTTTSLSIPSINFKVMTKTLSMAGDCVTTMQNAFGCARVPTATMATKLIATNNNTANPYCHWLCNCGAGYTMEMISIDANDTLPVELMDFAIEDEAS